MQLRSLVPIDTTTDYNPTPAPKAYLSLWNEKEICKRQRARALISKVAAPKNVGNYTLKVSPT